MSDQKKSGNEPVTEGASGGTPVQEDATEGASSTQISDLSSRFEQFVKLAGKVPSQDDEPKLESRLDEVSFEGIARFIASDKCKKIVTMAGAGISTSAGIPDFRSPGTGLYDNLEKYDLPNPQSVFAIDYFDQNPEPFFVLCKELWPGHFKPTPCHYFIRLLQKKNKLLTHFTQNIDTLESVAGITDDSLVEAHGSFKVGHCRKCSQEYTQEWMKEKILASSKSPVPICEQKGCDGVVKPDIVFFGESLPPKFVQHAKDLEECDCLIVMGTSLVVQPFASLTNRTKEDTPRLYINLENTSQPLDFFSMLFGGGGGFKFDDENNIRDVFKQSTCDDGCYALADLLGWGDELRALVKSEHARIDKENGVTTPAKTPQSKVPQARATGATAPKTPQKVLPAKSPAAAKSPSAASPVKSPAVKLPQAKTSPTKQPSPKSAQAKATPSKTTSGKK